MAGSGEIRILRQRVKSVKNTQQITRAMEMIAASRIVKAKKRVNAAKPYALQISEVIKGLAAASEVADHPLLSPHDQITTVGIVVMTSDRGLAGAYNANVLREAERVIAREEAAGHNVRLYLVGRKAEGYFKYRGRRGHRQWEGVSDQPEYRNAVDIADAFRADYVSEQIDRVWLVYTDFRSALTQTPNAMVLLPVDREELTRAKSGDRAEQLQGDFLFEPSPGEILERLIPRYVEAKVFAGMLESAASEHASRQRAMSSATDNADDVIDSLTRIMNQARQDQVTTEISEIVGGAEALSTG